MFFKCKIYNLTAYEKSPRGKNAAFSIRGAVYIFQFLKSEIETGKVA